MSKVHKITVQIAGPTGTDPGSVTFGYYTLDGDLLTMVDGAGTPMRRASSGEIYTYRLQPGEDPRRVAGRLTRDIRSAMNRGSDFHRRLNYGAGGIV